MDTSSVPGAAAAATPAPVTPAKQSILQRVEAFLGRIEGDIANDEHALVAFLKAHL